MNPDVNCDLNANCIDVPGSYVCRCRSGYTGNGTSCQGIAEIFNACSQTKAVLRLCSAPGSFFGDPCSSADLILKSLFKRGSIYGVGESCGFIFNSVLPVMLNDLLIHNCSTERYHPPEGVFDLQREDCNNS